MNHFYTRGIATVVIVFLATLVFAQPREPRRLDVSELMTAREFASAGLQKLTSGELDALNEWLAGYTGAVLRTAAATPEVIESQIDDEFEGWEGDTIFRLRNGQIWQQVSYAYTYHYAYAPKVLIYKSGSVYKMKVDGVRSEITVRRIK